MKEVKVIHLSSKIHLLARFVVVIELIVLGYLGGFFSNQLLIITGLVAPLTFFFCTAFIRFGIKYPYPISNEQISGREGTLDLAFPFVLYTGLFVIILVKALFGKIYSYTFLYISISIIESLLAVHAAIKLPRLFDRFPLS